MSDPTTAWTTHPAIRAAGLLGTAGFAEPAVAQAVAIAVEDGNLEMLKRFGISIQGQCGTGNIFIVDPAMKGINIAISLNGRSNNVFVIESGGYFKSNITVNGDNNIFIIMRVSRFNCNIECRAEGSALYIGRNCSAASASFFMEGNGISTHMGEDAMLSWSIYLRNGEGHGIIDLRRRKRINATGSLVVGPHVWLGQEVILNKGVTIGAGSIIGGRSIVTKSVPPTSLAVGAPAKVIRSGVTWSRIAAPSEAEIGRIADLPYLSDPEMAGMSREVATTDTVRE